MAKKGHLWILTAYAACVLVPLMLAGDNGKGAPRNADDPDITKPVLVHKVAPDYPEDARKEKVQGEVILEALVDKDGTVAGITVVSDPAPTLTEAAVTAVKQWRYTPATDKDNKPVAVFLKVTIQFRLS
jgi:protein TonB